MSKARTLANLISDNAVLADGQIAVAEVTGAAPLASPTFSGNVTTTGSFVVGNASLNENDLESIDGITAGTVAASKAVVVNSNKDASGFRNISLTGTVDGRDIATNIPASLGTAGQVLTVNSGANAGEWADVGGSPDLFAENYDGTSTAPSATGTNAIALGYSSVASGSRSLALIQGSTASGNRSIAAGLGAIASATNSIAIGSNNANASASGAIALGHDSKASGQYAIALGKSQASTEQGFAVQINNNTTSYGASGVFGSTAIGNTAKATGSVAIALGQGSIASGSKALAFGTGATASASNSVAIGYSTTANVADGVAIGGSGKQVKISGNYTLPTADGTNGQVMTTNGSGVISFAAAAGGADLYTANESSPTAQPSATGTNAIAIGDGAISTGTNSVALGKSRASGNNSLAAGISVNSTTYSSSGAGSIAMGPYANAGAANCVAIGPSANTSIYSNAVAIGRQCSSTASFQITLGHTHTEVKVSSAYTLPKVDGSANQVLTTAGNGTVSWAAAGGGADLYAANESSPTAQPSATGTNAIAIGDSAISTGSRTVAFSKSRSAGWDSIAGAILNNTTSYGTTSEGNIAFGEKAKVTGSASQGIGKLSITSGSQSMGLGYTATASGLRSYAFGYGAEATGTDTVSIGRSVTSTASNQVNIGGSTQDVRISEVYTLPKIDGSANQVLTTDGSGAVSWATAGSTTAGAVGTYAFCRRTSNLAFGTTYAGSSIVPAGASPYMTSSSPIDSGTNSSTTLSGTWRAMSFHTSVSGRSLGLFVRIS